jgi:hypothetical protein
MARWLGILIAVALTGLLRPSSASADADTCIGCKFVIIKPPPAAGGNGSTRFRCKGTFDLPSAGAAPTGGSLGVGVNVVPPGNEVYSIVSCTGLGSPPGSKGYKCGTRDTSLLITTHVVKGAMKFDAPYRLGQAHPFSGDVAITLHSTGTSDTKNYCARFRVASAVENDTREFKGTNSFDPTACSPSGAFIDAPDVP